MKIKALIDKINDEKPNSFGTDRLIAFINEVEIDVAEQLNVAAPTYTGFYSEAALPPTSATWNNGNGWVLFTGTAYVEQTGQTLDSEQTYYVETELLAKPPYDRLYVSWEKAQIDYANEEYASYQLNAEQFNQDFGDFLNWVVRTRQANGWTTPPFFRNIF